MSKDTYRPEETREKLVYALDEPPPKNSSKRKRPNERTPLQKISRSSSKRSVAERHKRKLQDLTDHENDSDSIEFVTSEFIFVFFCFNIIMRVSIII